MPLKGRFLLAFNHADIIDVLEQASRWTCRNFAYTDEIARGKITLLSKTPVTSEEAYAAFLAALNANNIAIYPSGRYYKLVRIADAKKAPIPTLLENGAEVPALEQPVTKLFKLRYADPDQLRGIMSNFTSPQGADIQSVPPDTLIVTDIGLNVRRIEKMIDAIDRPGASELIRFIQVRYASARDLAEKVSQVFQPTPGQAGKGGSRPVFAAPARPGMPAAAPAATGAEPGGFTKVLADERTNKLVVIADDKTYERIRDLVEQLDVPSAGEGQIHVIFMKNTSAEDLAQTLQALAQGQASAKRQGAAPTAPTTPGAPTPPAPPAAPPAGAAGATATLFSGEVKITADKVSNALLVIASGADFASVQRLVDELDRPRRQVFVEAVILEVNLKDQTIVGAGLHTAIPNKTSDGTGYIPLASEPGGPSFSSLNPLGAVLGLGGFLTGYVGPTPTELQTILPGVPNIGVLLKALQTNSDVNIISTPHILATDNEEAEITVGQNVPFQAGVISPGLSSLASTATTGTTSTSSLAGFSGLLGSVVAPIQRENVELSLKIKPQITEGDNIRLVIDEKTEDIAEKDATLGPTTNKRTIKTNISVKDQGTIVIGGLIQERTIQSVSKTPLLGDIPVLGWLFRQHDVTKQKTNLLLFLTPYIIHDQSDYRRIYERKRKEQEEFVQKFYGKKPEYKVTIDYARKAGPGTKVHRDVQAERLKLESGGPGAPGERSVTPPPPSEPPAAKPPEGEPSPAAPQPPPVPAPISPGADATASPPAPPPTPPAAAPPASTPEAR